MKTTDPNRISIFEQEGWEMASQEAKISKLSECCPEAAKNTVSQGCTDFQKLPLQLRLWSLLATFRGQGHSFIYKIKVTSGMLT